MVGGASAAQITVHYPLKEKITTDLYRYSGDFVEVGEITVGGDYKYIAKGWYGLNPGDSRTFNTPDDSLNKKLELIFSDGSNIPFRFNTYVDIDHYNNEPLTINTWDRGYSRYPHVDFTYDGKTYDGKNEKDIKIK